MPAGNVPAGNVRKLRYSMQNGVPHEETIGASTPRHPRSIWPNKTTMICSPLPKATVRCGKNAMICSPLPEASVRSGKKNDNMQFLAERAPGSRPPAIVGQLC